jgi:hypothetical protein
MNTPDIHASQFFLTSQLDANTGVTDTPAQELEQSPEQLYSELQKQIDENGTQSELQRQIGETASRQESKKGWDRIKTENIRKLKNTLNVMRTKRGSEGVRIGAEKIARILHGVLTARGEKVEAFSAQFTDGRSDIPPTATDEEKLTMVMDYLATRGGKQGSVLDRIYLAWKDELDEGENADTEGQQEGSASLAEGQQEGSASLDRPQAP